MVPADLINKRFTRLVVQEQAEAVCVGRDNRPQVAWRCLCDCGTSLVVTANNLRNGSTKSCGCFRREAGMARATHGHTRNFKASKLYRVWRAMVDRCYRQKATAYVHYGGRGITVCDRWRTSFANFLADMGEPSPGLTLDRIDNDGPYTPDNCRWATRVVQAGNTRFAKRIAIDSETVSLAEAARRSDVPRWTLCRRLDAGLSADDAIASARLYGGRDGSTCPSGHALTSDNVRVTKDGVRLCRECRRLIQIAYRSKRER